MPLSSIRELVKNDLVATDKAILAHLNTNIPLVTQVTEYILSCGGKRIRPLILLLSARSLSDHAEKQIDLAAVIELIHTATLLHDDVVDGATLRRGHKTAHKVWDSPTSVLVGDFLYSRAFRVVTDLRNQQILDIFAYATQYIAEGEIMQLVNCKNPDTTEEFYFEIIRRKTAKLFEMATELGAHVASDNPNEIAALRDFGMQLGLAYQLIDDALDYSQPAEETGKNIGQDISEGKSTLPLIYAMQKSKGADLVLLREAVESGKTTHLQDILGIIESTDAIKYTANAARKHADNAKQALLSINASPYQKALLDISDFVVSRTY